MDANTLHKCVVCGNDKPCTQSLALLREKNVWMVQPVCQNCRQALIWEAKAKGKFIPFFSLEASAKEAEKRNVTALSFKPFLEKFGRDRKDKVVEFPRGNKTSASKRSAD